MKDGAVSLRRNFEFDDVFLVNFINLNNEESEMVRNWRNNENIRRWMFSDHIISQEEHIRFIEGLKKNSKNFYWVVKNKEGEYLGVVSLNRVDFKNKNAYLGIYVSPDCQQVGTGHVLITCLKKITLDIARLHTLKLEVIETNARAIDFYKKSGFTEEGRLKEFISKDGRWLDVVVMGIIKRNEA